MANNIPAYRGLAYVVGIDDYENVTKLKNACNDARAIAKKFRDLNFYVMEDVDICRNAFIKRQKEFCERLQSVSVGVFYFAGHGVESGGVNYLLLKDSLASTPEDIKYNSFPLQDILNNMHASNCNMKIQIFDACRDNPFEGIRGIGSQKLAPINAPKGTLVAYSTSPGETAKDTGMGDNSIYTGALLQHLDVIGLPIEEFFKRVRTTVHNLTKGTQTSWEHTSLIGPFSFNDGMLIQSLNVGYPDEALKWTTWPISSRINKLKEDFLSGTYALQEIALGLFLKNQPQSYAREELFVIGRCIMRAASWNSFACIRFIEGTNLPSFFNGKENPLVDGMLYEIYFDDDGNFNGEHYQSDFLPILLRLCNVENVSCSFEFISQVLQPFSDRLLFIPSPKPIAVNLDVMLEDREMKTMSGGKLTGPTIVSVKCGQRELLNLEGNDFWIYTETKTKIKALREAVCKQYCVPDDFLKVTLSHPEIEEMYIKGGLVTL